MLHSVALRGYPVKYRVIYSSKRQLNIQLIRIFTVY